LTETAKTVRIKAMTQEINIENLEPAECILLAERLWEKARNHPDAIPVTEAQMAELNSRMDAIESGKMPPGESWEEVRRRLQSL